MDFLFPKGMSYPPEFHIPPLTGSALFQVGPFSYSNSHFTMLLVGIVLVALAYLGTRRKAEVPTGLQNVVELLVETLEGFVVSIGGVGAKRLLPLFGTLFLFIVFSNWLSITPFFGQVTMLRAPTSDYHINFGMAVVAFVAYQSDGFRKFGLPYASRWFSLSGFKQGVFIGAVMVLVGLIEFFSELFRMVTLTLRLWGNIIGGEIMLAVMSGLLFLPGLAVPFVGFEVFIGLIQGIVFGLLVLMYFVLALESHGDHAEEGAHGTETPAAHADPHHATATARAH